MQHKINFKEQKSEISYTKDFGEMFDVIAQKTITKVTMSKVLVHCQMGRSRSATLVIMYLLYKNLVDVKHDSCCKIDLKTIIKYV